MSFFLPSRSAPVSDNLRAATMMVIAMAAFAVNDALVKSAVQEIPPAQIMAVRGTIVCLLLFVVAWRRGMLKTMPKGSVPAVGLRTAFDVVATISYITALTTLPLANASAIFQALPFAVTLGAVLFLGERVGWRRWLAIGIGFLGVLVIVRPGTGEFSFYALLVLLSVAASASRDIVTRRMGNEMSAIVVAAIGGLGVALVGWLMLPFSGWREISASTLAVLFAAALAIAVGYVAVVAAMRGGEIGFVSPFRYTILVFAVLLGLVFFREVPMLLDMVGAAIVVGSGLYMIVRERMISRVKLAPTQGH